MIIRHRSFSFSKPKFPTEEEYNNLRKQFKSNPNTQIFLTPKFWDYFGKEIKNGIVYPFIISISFLLLSLINIEIFEWISGILGFYLFVRIIFYGIWEWGSFLKSNYDKKAYTKKLMKKILKSHSYRDFKDNNKFWMRMHPKH